MNFTIKSGLWLLLSNWGPRHEDGFEIGSHAHRVLIFMREYAISMARKKQTPNKDRILIVDDDPVIMRVLEANIRKQGYQVNTALTLDDARQFLDENDVDVVLLDVMFPEGPSLDFFDENIGPHTGYQVIMLTSSDSVELAVEAMKMGAYDYIRKPVEFERLFTAIGNALNVAKAQKEIAQLKKNLIEKYQFKKIIGESKPMKKLFEEMTSLLDKSTTILIQAESGTGKELVAKAIHYSGKKSKAPFVAVNCAAIPAGLLESELFGHERGAFTGAITRHIGKFEQADGGTIFLDEIGEMPLNAQARLLRVIQEREFERVGGSVKVKVAVRIIAATNQNLSDMVEQKRFREDLYYRLSVFPLVIPPLRERRDDIALLVAHLLYKYQEDNESEPHEISPEAITMLVRYRWPGNVRELENVIQRALILSGGEPISRTHLPIELQTRSRKSVKAFRSGVAVIDDDLQEVRPFEAIEKDVLEQALKATNGNISLAADQLEMGRATLYRKIKKYNIGE